MLLRLAVCFGLTLFLPTDKTSAQNPAWERTRLSIAEGLSDNNVSHVFRDSRGFAWISTQYGINRYDGYEFRTFTYDPSDTNSLSANWVIFSFEDRAGFLWMGAYGGGLCRFDPRTETFTRFGPGVFPADEASCAAQDPSGALWFGSINGGLCRYEPENRRFRAFPAAPDWLPRTQGNPPTPADTTFAGPPCPHVICILPENDRFLWVGTFLGLARFDKQTERFQYFFFDKNNPNSLPDNLIASLHYGADGRLWVETRQGWAVYRPESRDFDRAASAPGLPPGLGNDARWRDADGAWWAASAEGVEIYRPVRNPFALDRGSRYPVEAFDFKKCRTLLEAGGWLWIASSEGLWRCRLNTPGARLEKFLPHHFYTLQPGPEGKLWATAVREGIFQIDLASGAVLRFADKPEGFRPRSREILAVARDAWGQWWFAGRRTLDRFDPRTGRFESWLKPEYPAGLRPDDAYLFALWFDAGQGLWIGGAKGGLKLLRFDANGQVTQAEAFVHDPAQPASLSSNIVLCLHQDRRGQLWVGTDGGLNRLDAGWQPGQPARFRRYLRRDGLGDDKIMSIRDDARGRIWAGLLSHGLACLDGDSIRHYLPADGLPSRLFYLISAWQRPDGALLFGTTEGLAVFHPDSLQPQNPTAPPVYFTDLQLFGKTMPIGRGPGALPGSLLFNPEIVLRHDQNQLTFRFAALNFVHPEQNRYAYRLEPLDADWHDLGARREVSFSRLPPGRYRLHVKACNNAGIWNETGAALAFRIRPPWWQRGWAWAIYVLGIGAGGWALFRFQLRRQLERRETARLREIDELKSRFFANITHEFRTPLTLILGPVKKLRQEAAAPFSATLGLVERNAERLLKLVNQLLDLNKLDAGMLRPQWARCDFNALLADQLAAFRPAAEAGKVMLVFSPFDPPLTADCDPEKLAAILGNLLANALKATPPGGQIALRAEVTAGQIRIQVADTGPGIAAAHLPHLFDRFYRVDDSGTAPGTGIGLALAREMAVLLGGALSVVSSPGEGAAFSLVLPIRHNATATSHSPMPSPHIIPMETPASMPSPAAADYLHPQPLVLLVEDNADMRRYLQDCLGSAFRLEEARQGREGLAKALARVPDLVVSDVMMPEMDGYALCGALKADFRTSHIPVLLLTAKADLPARLEGYAQGADAYLSKPFHPAELLAQAQNLVLQRRRLWEKFSSGEAPGEAAGPEGVFWNQLLRLLQDHLADEHFSVEKMARAMAMSRTQLHRKVQALGGISAGRLLQNARLGKARQLLADSGLTVGEVAFQCGFSDPNYFTRLFVRTQGCTPTEYRTSKTHG